MMKVMVIGVVHNHGVSKAGANYDFAVVRYLRRIRPMDTKYRKVHAFGFEEVTINVDRAVLDQFSKFDFPKLMDLQLAPDPDYPDRNICVGVADAELAAA